MRCVLVDCEELPDWYTIDRKEHDGREWMEETGPGSMGYMCSSRPSDADIEGTSEEMLSIASAIEQGESVFHKRCAARVNGETYELFSPRNSQVPAVLTIEDAQLLAADIRVKIEDA